MLDPVTGQKITRRIQRKRTRGWKMPPGAIYVGRPSKWQNPFRIGRDGDATQCVERFREMIAGNIWTEPNKQQIQRELRGKDLACWCPLTDRDGNPVPCHADVLLWLANERR